MRVCTVCNSESVGHLLSVGDVVRDAHPRCAVEVLRKSGCLPIYGITPEMLGDPEFLAIMESITDGPESGPSAQKGE